MPIRVIEVIAPGHDRDKVCDALEKLYPESDAVIWTSVLEDDQVAFNLVHDVQESEDILDRLEDMFSSEESYRIMVYPAQATLPRLDPGPEPNGEVDKKERVSREELYSQVLDTSLLTKSYLLLIFFAAVISIIGLLRDNVAMIIGSMVLAPLLGPNVGLALGTTLGDVRLSLKALTTLSVGTLIVFSLAFVVGFLVEVPAGSQELIDRCQTTFSDLVLAMVSGGAGILSFTMGVPTSLVGVMVALALLPPLAASGLLLGEGLYSEAGGAALLFAANVICLNLAGVGMFLLQGVKPLQWQEKKKARYVIVRMVMLWALLFALLVGVLMLSQEDVSDILPETSIQRYFDSVD